MKNYDTLILGPISKDIIVTPQQKLSCPGGAVLYSAITAKRINSSIIALTKLSTKDIALLDVFAKYKVPIIHKPSKQTTSFTLIYDSEDRERRTCKVTNIAEPFELNDIPKDIKANLYYFGGLIEGDFPEELVHEVSKTGKIAIDVQGFLRVNENGKLVFKDWQRKREILPIVSFLKTDAAEAEILTGKTDRDEAIRALVDMGAKEIMLTHSSEVLAYAEGNVYHAEFKAKNLSGRTGRGDTCFAAYLTQRLHKGPEKALKYAAALTSIKMETPGPFKGNIEEVEALLATY